MYNTPATPEFRAQATPDTALRRWRRFSQTAPILAILLALSGACAADSVSHELPPISDMAKSGQAENELEFQGSPNGSQWAWSGAVSNENTPELGTARFRAGSFLGEVQLTASAGEPHLYVRRVNDGEIVFEWHGKNGVIDERFPVNEIPGGDYQFIVYVTGAADTRFEGNFFLYNVCPGDAAETEANDDPTVATEVTENVTEGRICNGTESLDRDYYTITAPESGGLLRLSFVHIADHGDLQMRVMGPLGEVPVDSHGRTVDVNGRPQSVTLGQTTESTGSKASYQVEVWGTDLWNNYQLITCFDDEGRNETPEASLPLELDGDSRSGVLCALPTGQIGVGFEPQPDYFNVVAPAGQAIRVILESEDATINLEAPDDALYIGDNVWEFAPAPVERQIEFGVFLPRRGSEFTVRAESS